MFPWSPLIDVVSKLIGLLPSGDAKLQAAKSLQEFELNMTKQQNEINLEEAKSGGWFAQNWRPAAGWLCVLGLGYSTVVAPMFHLPLGGTESLVSLLVAMLGLGTLRSIDKLASK